MTRDEAFARLNAIGAVTGNDARKLVEMLPEQALAVMSEGWIRPQHDEPSTLEFFWSRGGLLLSPGNRTTTIRSRGDGQFTVELRNSSPERFNESMWQQNANGQPMVNTLSLNDKGAEKLLIEVCKWQLGSKW